MSTRGVRGGPFLLLRAVPPGGVGQHSPPNGRRPPARCPPLPSGLAPALSAPRSLSLCAPASRRARERPPRSAGRERRGRGRRCAVRAFGGRASRASPSRTASPHGYEFGNSHGSPARGTSAVLPGEGVSLGRPERGQTAPERSPQAFMIFSCGFLISAAAELCAAAELGAGVWEQTHTPGDGAGGAPRRPEPR